MTNQWIRWPSPQALCQAMRARIPALERGQSRQPQTRYTYTDGPMYWLGQQICKAMQDSGHPAFIFECYRTLERQQQLFEQRPKVTNAGPGQSAHNFYEAVDIVHPELFWSVSPAYWQQLDVCVRIVADKYRLSLVHGHHWRFVDSPHVELKDWRKIRHRYQTGEEGGAIAPYREPTRDELSLRFQEVLPHVWANRP